MVKILLLFRQMLPVVYILILTIGLYLVGVSVYNVLYSGTRGELIANTFTAAIGGGLALYGGYKLSSKEKKSDGKGQQQGQRQA
jgi:membrane protein implicated in regulation of membrane protease activity